MCSKRKAYDLDIRAFPAKHMLRHLRKRLNDDAGSK